MNLLPPKEAKEAKEREQRAAAELSAKYEKEINLRKQQLNELNDRYSSQTSSLAKGLEELSLSIAQRKSVLEGEVQVLEERRAKALLPIKDIETKALKLQADNEERQMRLGVEESSLAASKAQVLESLMSVEEMRDKLGSKKVELDMREDSIKRQEEFGAASQDALSKKWTEFNATVTEKMKEFSDRDDRLLAEQHSLEVLKQENIKDKEENAKEKILLADERKTLERAMQRIKN